MLIVIGLIFASVCFCGWILWRWVREEEKDWAESFKMQKERDDDEII